MLTNCKLLSTLVTLGAISYLSWSHSACTTSLTTKHTNVISKVNITCCQINHSASRSCLLANTPLSKVVPASAKKQDSLQKSNKLDPPETASDQELDNIFVI